MGRGGEGVEESGRMREDRGMGKEKGREEGEGRGGNGDRWLLKINNGHRLIKRSFKLDRRKAEDG